MISRTTGKPYWLWLFFGLLILVIVIFSLWLPVAQKTTSFEARCMRNGVVSTGCQCSATLSPTSLAPKYPTETHFHILRGEFKIFSSAESATPACGTGSAKLLLYL